MNKFSILLICDACSIQLAFQINVLLQSFFLIDFKAIRVSFTALDSDLSASFAVFVYLQAHVVVVGADFQAHRLHYMQNRSKTIIVYTNRNLWLYPIQSYR